MPDYNCFDIGNKGNINSDFLANWKVKPPVTGLQFHTFNGNIFYKNFKFTIIETHRSKKVDFLPSILSIFNHHSILP